MVGLLREQPVELGYVRCGAEPHERRARRAGDFLGLRPLARALEHARQIALRGDPFVGAKLGNLLQAVGYRDIEVAVKPIHLDNRAPEFQSFKISSKSGGLLSLMMSHPPLDRRIDALRRGAYAG